MWALNLLVVLVSYGLGLRVHYLSYPEWSLRVLFSSSSASPMATVVFSLQAVSPTWKTSTASFFLRNIAQHLCRPRRLKCSCSTTDQEGPHATVRHQFPGLVFDVGESNSWDSIEVGSPVVKRYIGDVKERWLMWYHGAGGDVEAAATSIGIALSNNGIHWERGSGVAENATGPGQVMRRSEDWWAFDREGLRPSEVLIMSSDKLMMGQSSSTGVYWLYYTGWSTPEKESCPLFFPGLAVSQDGWHWARIEGDHHTGAVMDVGEAPKVVQHARRDLRMYYHASEKGKHVIRMARSRDGLQWMKMDSEGDQVLGPGPAGTFDESGVRKGHVVRNSTVNGGGGYVMVYEGVSVDGRTSIGLAVSADGLKDWQRCGTGAVLEPSSDGWDCCSVEDPCLVLLPTTNEWWLYYKGIGADGKTGIGLAITSVHELGQPFRRWTGMIPAIDQ